LQYEREKRKHGGDRRSNEIKSSAENQHLIEEKTCEKLAEQHKVAPMVLKAR
jgi:hypothetical protein